MIKQISLFLFLAFAISSCCKKNEATPNLCTEPNVENSSCTSDSNQIKLLILHKWNWTQRTSSWTQEKANPCTQNNNYSYEFKSDGTIRHVENSEVKETMYYYFQNSNGTQIFIEDSMSHLYHPFVSASGWISICNNHLIIDDSPVDGPKDIFVKAN